MPSMGGGAADGLKDVLARLYLQTQLKQQAQQASARLGEDQRQANMVNEVDLGRLKQNQDQFTTTRTDRQNAAAAEQTAAAKSAADMETFEGTMPEHLRGAFHASGHKSNFKPEDFVNAPETLDQQDVRGLRQKEGESKIIEARDLRLIGARVAEERRNAAAKPTAPADAASSAYTNERQARTRQSVTELMGKVNNWTAGAGSVLSAIPATDARNFNAELDSLKANIAFGELAEMRQASKTGGALGAVSERELALLESTLGALDPGQSPANLKSQLAKVIESLDRWQMAKGAGGAPAGGVRVQPGGSTGTGGMQKELDYVPGKGFVPRGGG